MYKLLQGDCLDLMKDISDKSIDMVLCDLPYGVTARNGWDEVIPFDLLWEEYKRIIKNNGTICLFGQGMFTAKLMTSNPKMWRYNLVWRKTQPTGFLNANRMPLRNHEDICIFCKEDSDNICAYCHEDICVFYKQLPTYNPQKTTGHTRKVSSAEHKKNCKVTTNYGEHNLKSYDSTERYPTSVITYSKDIQKTALHPTQKPVALLEYLIRTYTNEGETVLDNCMGSGSTGIACLNTNRHFIGMELDEKYFEIAKNRIESHKT